MTVEPDPDPDRTGRKREAGLLGLADRRVVLVDHDPAWIVLFAEEASRIREALPGMIDDVQHCGSTAVPGLRAKPILDILVGASDLVRSRACIGPLEAKLGYVCLGDHVVPGECFFFRGNPRTHHLHLAITGGPVWRSKIAFRDMLLANRDLAHAYESEKLVLAARFPNDRDSYTRGKADFIERATGGAGPERQSREAE